MSHSPASSTTPATVTRLTTDQAPISPTEAWSAPEMRLPIRPPAASGAVEAKSEAPVTKARNSSVTPTGRCQGRSGICSMARMTIHKPSAPVTSGTPQAPSPAMCCRNWIQDSVSRPRLSVTRLSRVSIETAIRAMPHNSGRSRKSEICCSVSGCRRDLRVRLLVAMRLW